MNNAQAALTRVFVGTARQARQSTGARDADVVPALLAAAHSIAMRGDPVWNSLTDRMEAETRDLEVAS